MAGQRQPIELVVAKGKKHLTKAEIEQRKKSEVKAKSDNIKPPKNLTKDEKKEFKKIANELAEIDIMSNLDCNSLGMYIRAYGNYVKVSDKLMNLDPLNNFEEYNKLSILEDRHAKQCRNYANDLGLTISSRCRLVVPKPPEEPKKNKFSKFGGG
ncbi:MULTISPECIES: phage terminase small subunit P27 family [Bacillota]|uniref:phage terminase small subunit P27 family n=1 Tax=Bacillota TaxID=1239 RepID=UPI00257128A6|nr:MULTISPECIES: phage terminase small subunit P27 family [Bacillota]